MEEQDKQLLFKDLSARLPYGVKMQFSEKFPEWFAKKHGEGTTVTPFTLDVSSIGFVMIDINNDVNHVKPYLRPMSSMTEKENEEFIRLCYTYYEPKVDGVVDLPYGTGYDWLLEHHFDYRGLIPMGLALEAKEGMYES